MADTKLADLTALTTPSGDDILYIVDDPAGTPLDRKIALDNLFTRGTITADAPVLNMSQTWNNAAVTFTGLKFNAAGTSDANSAAASLLMDLQVGGTSKFKVSKIGLVTLGGGNQLFTDATGLKITNTAGVASFVARSDFSFIPAASAYAWGDMATFALDLLLTRRAAANLRLGAADSAAPVAQTLSVQSITGTNASAAAYPFKITGAQGTGNAAGGSIIFQVAPAGGSGAAQNTPVDALTINSAQQALFSAGTASAPSLAFAARTTQGFYDGGGYIVVALGGQKSATFGTIQGATTGAVTVPSGGGFAFSSTNDADGALDTYLRRDAANTLALRNGANAQAFRLYNTFTNATDNFERANIFWDSNVLKIGTEKGSVGGTARALEFQTDGTTRLTIAAAGSATFSGFTVFSGGTIRLANSDGDITLSSGTVYIPDTTRFAIGGSTSSFPALKRVSANLQVIAADGTSSAGLIVGNQALATAATDGFLYVPTCAGTPTGTPTAQTGTAPIVINTTNNKLYFYSDGQWRDAGP